MFRRAGYSGSIALLLLALLLIGAWPRSSAAETDPAALEADFQRGLAALEVGEPGRAIPLFRAILAADPGLHRVRLELARAYFFAENWTDARREFFAVLSPDVPAQVKSTIIDFLQLIDARRGWTWELDVGLRASPSNGRRLRSDTVTLNIGGDRVRFDIDEPDDADFGAFIDGALEFRVPFSYRPSGATLGAIARVEAGLVDYVGGGEDDQSIGAQLGLLWSWPQTTATLTPVIRRFWRDGARLEDRIGANLTVEHRTSDALSLFGRLAATYIDDALLDDRDGWRTAVQAGVGRAFGGRSFASAALAMGRFEAEEDFESFHFVQVDFALSTELVGGWAPRLDLFAAIERYKERAPLFFDRRADELIGAVISLEKRDLVIGGFTPFASVGQSRRFSNIELYDYYDTIWRVGLRKLF